MNIAIVGGGITGLTAAYYLTKKGHSVTVFEKEKFLGGLSHGFKNPGWDWPLEAAYHHIFTNDSAIINLVHELNFADHLFFKRPVTATLLPLKITRNKNSRSSLPELNSYKGDVKNKLKNKIDFEENRGWRAAEQENFYSERFNQKTIYQLDSPLNLLQFNKLSMIDRLRTGAMLAFLKLNPFWKPLENITAEKFIQTLGGNPGWKILWEPLLYGKFGDFAPTVAASWFWARIKKRTPSLGYFTGGFQTFIDKLATDVENNGGKIQTEAQIDRIIKTANDKFQIKLADKSPQFDKILLTTPSPVAAKLINFPKPFVDRLLSIPHLWAQTLILETTEPILKDVYWLNINDRNFPFLAAVAHTNFIDKKHYAGHHLTYFGNYFPANHPYLTMTKEELLNTFLPYIKSISPIFNYKFSILNSFLYIAPFAQPVHQLHYSTKAPPLETPIPNVYIANLDSIYPWDRGTNYAVDLGKKVSELIDK
jgi:protoporphyrinogen oxidase